MINKNRVEVKKHKAVLAIAGFDPSGGAGVLADCKTFEQNGAYGCAVVTAITHQNDKDFYSLKWLGFDEILEQFKPLAERFEFDVAKIGLIENLETLHRCITLLLEYNPEIRIIWDPILKASAGFHFHEQIEIEILQKILKTIYLVTPNYEEMQTMFPDGFQAVTEDCSILLKGGHGTGEFSSDILYHRGLISTFKEKRLEDISKHGSGCVLSAAIAAYLHHGKTLKDACQLAKQYTLSFLRSSPTLIGFHFSANSHAINS